MKLAAILNLTQIDLTYGIHGASFYRRAMADINQTDTEKGDKTKLHDKET